MWTVWSGTCWDRFDELALRLRAGTWRSPRWALGTVAFLWCAPTFLAYCDSMWFHVTYLKYISNILTVPFHIPCHIFHFYCAIFLILRSTGALSSGSSAPSRHRACHAAWGPHVQTSDAHGTCQASICTERGQGLGSLGSLRSRLWSEQTQIDVGNSWVFHVSDCQSLRVGLNRAWIRLNHVVSKVKTIHMKIILQISARLQVVTNSVFKSNSSKVSEVWRFGTVWRLKRKWMQSLGPRTWWVGSVTASAHRMSSVSWIERFDLRFKWNRV